MPKGLIVHVKLLDLCDENISQRLNKFIPLDLLQDLPLSFVHTPKKSIDDHWMNIRRRHLIYLPDS